MSDGDALLRSVLVAPADDAPRLVYADWLDENGEGERAEFIRVQVELARLKHPDKHYHWRGTADCDGCRAKRLHKRERAILREWIHWPNGAEGTREAWWYEQMAATGIRLHDLPTYRRGFVAHVELTTAAFLGGPCGRCGGRGLEANGYAYEQPTCRSCNGSGRTPGIAKELFAAQPVTAVRLTDKRPTHQEVEGYWFWLRGRPDTPATRLANEPYWIPAPLWQYLGKYEQPTEQAANADLSAACVAYARELAHLPPFPGPCGRPANPAGG